MKTKLIIILFASLLGCDLCGHKTPLTELEKLPPVTREGKNTFGCLVNGKASVTKTSIDAAASYRCGFFSVEASLESEGVRRRISLTALDRYMAPGEFRLDDANCMHRLINSQDTACRYPFSAIGGKLVIDRFDKEDCVVAGSFSVTFYYPDCDTVRVTNGRFDLPLNLNKMR